MFVNRCYKVGCRALFVDSGEIEACIAGYALLRLLASEELFRNQLIENIFITIANIITHLFLVIYYIPILMDPKQKSQNPEKQAEAEKMAGDMISIDESIAKINNLSVNKMEKMAQASRERASKKQSLDHIDMKKIQSLDFSQQLNLDMLIQRVLGVLMKTKVQLKGLDDLSEPKNSQKYKMFLEYFEEELKKYNKTLMLRQSQLGALVFVIEHRKDADFQKKYAATYGQLDKFIISPEQAKKPINQVILQQALQKQIQYLNDYSQAITVLKKNFTEDKQKNDIDTVMKNANRLKIINSKIATIAEVFPYACVLNKDDLFSFPKNSQRWHKLLQKYIRYKIYGDKQTIKKSFVQLKNGLNFVNASMSIMHKTRSSWVGTTQDLAKDIASLADSTSKIFKFLIFKQDATHQAEVLISNPDGTLAKQIWNLPETKMVKNLISMTLPSITYSKQFWIPREFLQYLMEEGKCQMPNLEITNMETYRKHLFEQKQHKQKLQMRINCPFNLTFRGQKQPENPVKSFFENIFQAAKTSQQMPRQVIYHIHGGGFISMSSFVHQTYTRVWANNLKVPIISVDYGKAPQFPYPNGLFDCFEGYMWVLHYYKQVFNAQPKKIILVGDSAGGNLVAALTTMLIMRKIRPPDGVVLVYPALNLNYHNYTPSLLNSLNDMILPHTFLKICLKAYLPQGTDVLNPFVSPIQTPHQILKQYPPTRLFVGSSDPFHDDCCRITETMNYFVPGKAKLMIFDEFPHGFLQFDMKTQPHQACRKATKQVQQALSQLLKL